MPTHTRVRLYGDGRGDEAAEHLPGQIGVPPDERDLDRGRDRPFVGPEQEREAARMAAGDVCELIEQAARRRFELGIAGQRREPEQPVGGE